MRSEVEATQLSMTCSIERFTVTGRDRYNHPVTEWATHLSAVPCYWWEHQEREVLGPNVNALLSKEHLVLPAGTDVTVEDRIASVTGALGETLAGPLQIRAVRIRLNDVVVDVEAQVSA